MSKVGLVLEGGSLRGIYSSGILDYLIEQHVSFPYVVGVSAGAGNAANFISGQKGRTKKAITHANTDSFFGLSQMAMGGKMLNLNKLVGYDKVPFDWEVYNQSDTQCDYVVTNARTGKADYLTDNGSFERLLNVCKASCSIPMMTDPTMVDGTPYFDGSIIDSIPFERAFNQGCDKVFVILTRNPGDTPTDYNKMKLLLEVGLAAYPRVTEAMIMRSKVYDKQMAKLKALVKAKKAFVMRPSMSAIGHFEGNKEKIDAYYRHGYSQMKKEYKALMEFMS